MIAAKHVEHETVGAAQNSKPNEKRSATETWNDEVRGLSTNHPRDVANKCRVRSSRFSSPRDARAAARGNEKLAHRKIGKRLYIALGFELVL